MTHKMTHKKATFNTPHRGNIGGLFGVQGPEEGHKRILSLVFVVYILPRDHCIVPELRSTDIPVSTTRYRL